MRRDHRWPESGKSLDPWRLHEMTPNAALERLVHASNDKDRSSASPLQALVRPMVHYHQFIRRSETSVGCGVGEARVLSPTDPPLAFAPGHDQHLAAPNNLVGGALISRQRTEESYDRRVRAHEG
jgi:hypothetical protein